MKVKVILAGEILFYCLLVCATFSLAKYLHGNALIPLFILSLIFNLLLIICFNKNEKIYNVILLNIFFGLAILSWPTRNQFLSIPDFDRLFFLLKELGFCGGIYFLTGNWLLPIILLSLKKSSPPSHNKYVGGR